MNLCYAQSGGVTAVINATAAAVLSEARKTPKINRVLAAKNGILGVLQEELIETWRESPAQLRALQHTPGGAFGSCRVKLPQPARSDKTYARLMAVFRAHNIGFFLYNGGNDSADSTLKISHAAKLFDWPLTVIGIPKTIDNDLAKTDTCPGFGSVAKYIAVSVAETTLDVAAMAKTSTKVFILEVMGRHAGWIVSAAGLVANGNASPHLLLFPEKPFERKAFMAALGRRVAKHGYAVVVASEGLRDNNGEFLSAADTADSFAHRQLGGVAPLLAAMIGKDCGLKCHWSVADYLQRSARHIASATDVKQATALGVAAVHLAATGKNAVMPVIRRLSDKPYRWRVDTVNLAAVANHERKMPAGFIGKDGYSITAACRRYLTPLIHGENYPPFTNGLPRYITLKNTLTKKKLPEFSL